MCGDVGGVSTVFVAITAMLMAPYCQKSFQIKAIQELYEIKYKKTLKKLNLIEKIGHFMHI